MDRKPDANEIEQIIDDLVKTARATWTNPGRNWPGWLYHVTDIRNAASILTDGKLVSRVGLANTGRMSTDAAAPEIISWTSARVQNHVRFYFRPMTPTFLHSEGMRTSDKKSGLGSYCPSPVALLVDAKSVLIQLRTQFTDGNASSPRARFGSTAEFMKSIPFADVFHDGPMPEERIRDLTFRRNAEVLVPDSLDLASVLRYVFVRSIAEYETLISLMRMYKSLAPGTTAKIMINKQSPLFFKRWTFVNRVVVTPHGISFHFNPDTESSGPFNATIEIVDLDSGEPLYESDKFSIMAKGKYHYELPRMVSSFRLCLVLDEAIAYQNEFYPPYNSVVMR